ncbi:DUF937 domain-containing protein [Mariniblastus fucicola]|uniref:DUF937 domain-containing protein n=1 Tax=Mariniblastus fucicola TaxID=980251 RepID=A0A5B9PC38_9BACT|nr:DUF937 domain-containing protein [Mariniblastus fucicola]QEG20671.1 hypothetical protein MFFC18_05210 [Mariniblastus fucicola]
MSVNIMDLVKGAVSDQVMGQIGGLLGTDAKKTPSLFETAAGSILGGLMKKASTPQGAQDIFGAAQKQDDSVLDKLGDLLGGGDSTDEFEKQGSGILDMVLGGGQQTNGMIGMIAKSLGLDKGVVGKLLMMAAPIIMGVIGKHIKNKALDAVGLGNLLGEQKSHLGKYMPASLTNDLGFSNMLGSASDAVGTAGGAARDAVGNAAGAASSSGGSLLKYIIPIGLLGILAVFGVPWIMDMMSRSGGAALDQAEISVTPLPGAGIDGLDFASVPFRDSLGETGPKLMNSFADIASGLESVADEDGAKSLADKISSFTGNFDSFGLDKLDGNPKAATIGLVSTFVETVNDLLSDKSEGVRGILKPVIDLMMEKLAPFIGAQNAL